MHQIIAGLDPVACSHHHRTVSRTCVPKPRLHGAVAPNLGHWKSSREIRSADCLSYVEAGSLLSRPGCRSWGASNRSFERCSAKSVSSEGAQGKEVEDVSRLEDRDLTQLYYSHCKGGNLKGALNVVETAFKDDRHGVLSRLVHKSFLRLARNLNAVEPAIQFVRMLPREVVDVRTYNLLVSVCTRGGDYSSVLSVVKMLEEDGIKPDLVLYTNLITACAHSKKVDEAFKLYRECKSNLKERDPKLYGAVCFACSKALTSIGSQERRSQLVMMERALTVVDDMIEDKIRPDPHIWNILIACTGRAGHLQRCFEVLQKMQESGCLPDTYTYSALVSACTRNGERQLALKVFNRALLEETPQSIVLYTLATKACLSKDGSDLEKALEIYDEVQRSGVEPTADYFGALIKVAGRSGNLELAFAIEDDMMAYGIKSSSISKSALLFSCLIADDLDAALNIYNEMIENGMFPDITQVHFLIVACGAARKMGDVVNIVEDMIEAGRTPDKTNYTAIMSACTRAGELEIAFAVAQEMQLKRIPVDEGVCCTLLRVCYNSLVALWHKDRSISCKKNPDLTCSTSIGLALVRLLHGPVEATMPDVIPRTQSELVDKAVFIYRRLIEDDNLPSMKVLNRLMACLRIPYHKQPVEQPEEEVTQIGHQMQVDPRLADLHMGAVSDDTGAEKSTSFDRRALPIVREAMRLGVLPQLTLDGDVELDLTDMMPAIAEVYILALANDIKRNPTVLTHSISLRVPRFNPKKVMVPSSFEWQEMEPEGDDDDQNLYNRADTPSIEGEEEGEYDTPQPEFEPGTTGTAGSSTGSGVLAILQKLKFWCDVIQQPKSCLIWISPDEVAQWARKQKRYRVTEQSHRKFQAGGNNREDQGSVFDNFGDLGPLENQQWDIRADW